ncbi:MAG: bifunctional oligoribonuclease/PAP phosphatase NrnA [Crocinitomicaceae bacterium]|nr:bifunctional oligoribonuclease/PAP phosphatase NrnA [Crocinitomicaceae bacterium]
MKEAKKIVDLIEQSEKIVITSHRSPDGDSIGSSLGLYRFIKALGKNAEICHPDPCPNFLNWVKDNDVILNFENNEAEVRQKMNDADLIFSLDYNAASRLGKEMSEVLLEAKGTKVMIDHHLHPDDFVDVAVSEPTVCSTSQLVYEFIVASGRENLMSASIGTPLYLGIMTDTGSFRFSSVTPRTHEILAAMLTVGVVHTDVHEKTFDNNRLDKLRLRSHIIAERLELLKEHKVAIISVTENEMERFNFIKGDTEGLVNVALGVEGVSVAVFFSEKGGVVKISFRSKGEFAVNELANDHFGGGGHKFAAGGISELGLDETIAKFKGLVPEYFI